MYYAKKYNEYIDKSIDLVASMAATSIFNTYKFEVDRGLQKKSEETGANSNPEMDNSLQAIIVVVCNPMLDLSFILYV